MKHLNIKIVDCGEPQYTKIDGNNITIFISGDRSKEEFYYILPEEPYAIKVIYSGALRKYWDHLPSIIQVQYRKQVQYDLANMLRIIASLVEKGKMNEELLQKQLEKSIDIAWCLE